MFSTDYVSYACDAFSADPVGDLNRWIALVKTGLNEINERCGWPCLSQEEIDNLLCNTASKLYGIPVK